MKRSVIAGVSGALASWAFLALTVGQWDLARALSEPSRALSPAYVGAAALAALVSVAAASPSCRVVHVVAALVVADLVGAFVLAPAAANELSPATGPLVLLVITSLGLQPLLVAAALAARAALAALFRKRQLNTERAP